MFSHIQCLFIQMFESGSITYWISGKKEAGTTRCFPSCTEAIRRCKFGVFLTAEAGDGGHVCLFQTVTDGMCLVINPEYTIAYPKCWQILPLITGTLTDQRIAYYVRVYGSDRRPLRRYMMTRMSDTRAWGCLQRAQHTVVWRKPLSWRTFLRPWGRSRWGDSVRGYHDSIDCLSPVCSDVVSSCDACDKKNQTTMKKRNFKLLIDFS